jgi:hypothetical protein
MRDSPQRGTPYEAKKGEQKTMNGNERKYPLPLEDYLEIMMSQECEALMNVLKTKEKPDGKIPVMKCLMNRLTSFYKDYLDNFGTEGL